MECELSTVVKLLKIQVKIRWHSISSFNQPNYHWLFRNLTRLHV